MNKDNYREEQFQRWRVVSQRTGFSRAKLYAMIDENSKGYDPDFPKPIKLGKGAVAWLSTEIDEWIKKKVIQTRGLVS